MSGGRRVAGRRSEGRQQRLTGAPVPAADWGGRRVGPEILTTHSRWFWLALFTAVAAAGWFGDATRPP